MTCFSHNILLTKFHQLFSTVGPSTIHKAKHIHFILDLPLGVNLYTRFVHTLVVEFRQAMEATLLVPLKG